MDMQHFSRYCAGLTHLFISKIRFVRSSICASDLCNIRMTKIFNGNYIPSILTEILTANKIEGSSLLLSYFVSGRFGEREKKKERAKNFVKLSEKGNPSTHHDIFFIWKYSQSFCKCHLLTSVLHYP
ncbi:unnamed protein product [Brugia timori]|uniref:Uncharacterized protein n=1 Tax=Brugia timori TaxID=42155 RepID=A0A0R3QHY1_9BILA|nr:unnamed protein product [Brugia timori]